MKTRTVSPVTRQGCARRDAGPSSAELDVALAEMQARPILFSGPMVRALLEGRKTQTRRIVREMPGNSGGPVGEHVCWFERGTEDATRWCGHDGLGSVGWVRCPYGEPGGRLWVRETWAPRDERAMAERDRAHLFYRADDEAAYDSDGAWRPSIHMPRWASRLRLEVTDVRVERLQAITHDDAMAEGMTPNIDGIVDVDGQELPPRVAFSVLWDTINGKRAAWASNPWVWVVSLRRLGA